MFDAICVAFADGAPPEWIDLMPIGAVVPNDDRDPWTLKDPHAVIAATMALCRDAGLPIDYDHATDLAAPEGRPAPAAGWLREFRVENGKLQGRVEWTDEGAAAVASKAYKYLSPVFDFNKSRVVQRIKRAALTNNPALTLTALAAKQAEKGDGMDHDECHAKMAKMLGCKADASHEDLCAAMSKYLASAKTAKDGDGGDDEKTASRLIAAGKVVSQESHSALLTKVNQIEADHAQERASVKVEAAIAAGKLQKPQRDWALAYCASDPDGFDEFIGKQVAMKIDGESIKGAPRSADGGGAALTAPEQAVCSFLRSITPGQFVAEKAKGRLVLNPLLVKQTPLKRVEA